MITVIGKGVVDREDLRMIDPLSVLLSIMFFWRKGALLRQKYFQIRKYLKQPQYSVPAPECLQMDHIIYHTLLCMCADIHLTQYPKDYKQLYCAGSQVHSLPLFWYLMPQFYCLSSVRAVKRLHVFIINAVI